MTVNEILKYWEMEIGTAKPESVRKANQLSDDEGTIHPPKLASLFPGKPEIWASEQYLENILLKLGCKKSDGCDE